jgi:hypothetical protein
MKMVIGQVSNELLRVGSDSTADWTYHVHCDPASRRAFDEGTFQLQGGFGRLDIFRSVGDDMGQQLVGSDVLFTSPQWTSAGFARRGVEDCTAFFEATMGMLYVYTEKFQSAWSKGTSSDRALFEDRVISVCCLDMGSEFV